MKDEVLFWHDSKWMVHALTVMPDHVHVLATPLEASPGISYSLSEILRSVKMGSALRINRARGRSGRLWQPESFDRIMFSAHEFEEKEKYIIDNARRKGLTEDPWGYDGLWHPGMLPLGGAGPRPARIPADEPRGPSRARGIPANTMVVKKRRDLPHCQVGGAAYFITFRLKRSRLGWAGRGPAPPGQRPGRR